MSDDTEVRRLRERVDALRAWMESRAAYYAKDAKELKAEAAKLARSNVEGAMFRYGCADYAAGFAAELRRLLVEDGK